MSVTYESTKYISEIGIDDDLNMGAHNILLDAAQTVDGVDVSLRKTNVDQLIKQIHPVLQILGAIDTDVNLDTHDNIYQILGLYWSDGTVYSLTSTTWTIKYTYTLTEDIGHAIIYGDIEAETTNYAYIGYSINDAVTPIQFGLKRFPGYATKHVHIGVLSSGDVLRFWLRSQFSDAWVHMTNLKIYASADLSGNALSDALTSNSAVLSFFKHLKGKFSNGESSHATPVQAEIYGDADSYAAALNGTTKFTIDPSNPRIELYREDISEVAKGALQTTWIMDDNATNGALPSKTEATYSTILAEEIGIASIISVEKSILGDFTDTIVLAEDDDYVVDYSTKTATEIILSDGTGITTSSKLRINWIADVMDIDAGTNNTALKLKIYLNRTAVSEASPEIQLLDIGTSKYAEMLYGT